MRRVLQIPAYVAMDAIQRWQGFYWYLRAESPRSQKFLRAVGVSGVFCGVLFVAAAISLTWSPIDPARYFWVWIVGSATITSILIPRR